MGGGVDAAYAEGGGQVGQYLVGGAYGETHIEGAGLHVTVDAVGRDALCLTEEGQEGSLALEGTEAVVELALAAATGDGETGHNAPFLLIIGEHKGRHYGSDGVAVELLCGLAFVRGTEPEGGESGTGVAALLRDDIVQIQVESVAEEGRAGGIGIETVDVDDSLLRHLAQEMGVLVRVREQSTGSGGERAGHKGHEGE